MTRNVAEPPGVDAARGAETCLLVDQLGLGAERELHAVIGGDGCEVAQQGALFVT